MELALQTGWTPAVIASLPGTFRRACHWRLWVGAIVGPEGLSDPDSPGHDAPPASVRAWADAVKAVRAVRAAVYPEGD